MKNIKAALDAVLLTNETLRLMVCSLNLQIEKLIESRTHIDDRLVKESALLVQMAQMSLEKMKQFDREALKDYKNLDEEEHYKS